uniref:Uncharacterized protein n=1 Tax=Noctiluca scintillans TaxID=2966 RepID=A0A7S1AKA4_NOCSC
MASIEKDTVQKRELRYASSAEDLKRAQELVERTTGAEDYGTHRAVDGRVLMVFFTDLEPDDIMACAQLSQLWLAPGETPLVLFSTDLRNKDQGNIFANKLTMARLALGPVEFCVFKSGQQHMRLDAAIRRVAQFPGDTIRFYIMAPGRGFLAEFLNGVKERCEWPPRQAWHVSMYSGSFNVRGMSKKDLQSLQQLTIASGTPLVDVSRFVFFGRDQALPCTKNLEGFVPSDFGENVRQAAPLLAAVMELFNEEFNGRLIHPDHTKLFRPGQPLNRQEEERFARIRLRFDQNDCAAIREYARGLFEDAQLFSKVADYKCGTVRALAHGSINSPLCDQLLFLHEWLTKERPWWLCLQEGRWSIDKDNGFSCVTQGDEGGPRAVQPVLQDPAQEDRLAEMAGAMEKYFIKHLASHDTSRTVHSSSPNMAVSSM